MLSSYKYDIFISYAVEDKLELAHPFCQQLEEKGLKVWYSGRELRYGESIEKVVKEGLEQSRYGIILITPNYFEKKWTIKELYSLWSMEKQGRNIILPVFHEVTHQDVALHDPILADRWAFTTDKGLDHIASEVEKVVKDDFKEKKSKKSNRLILTSLIAIILCALCFFGFKNYFIDALITEKLVTKTITQRIKNRQHVIMSQSNAYLKENNALPINQQEAISIQSDFEKIVSRYENKYEFNSGNTIYKYKKHVEPQAKISFDTLSAINNYGFSFPIINKISSADDSVLKDIKLHYFNTQPITFKILKTQYSDTLITLSVAYTNHIREFILHYQYGFHNSYSKITNHKIYGLKPIEQYYFIKDDQEWSIMEIK